MNDDEIKQDVAKTKLNEKLKDNLDWFKKKNEEFKSDPNTQKKVQQDVEMKFSQLAMEAESEASSEVYKYLREEKARKENLNIFDNMKKELLIERQKGAINIQEFNFIISRVSSFIDHGYKSHEFIDELRLFFYQKGFMPIFFKELDIKSTSERVHEHSVSISKALKKTYKEKAFMHMAYYIAAGATLREAASFSAHDLEQEGLRGYKASTLEKEFKNYPSKIVSNINDSFKDGTSEVKDIWVKRLEDYRGIESAGKLNEEIRGTRR